MNRLQSELRRIDHRGYPAYKDLRGSYDFGKYILNIEHIQGDPFASPSSLSVKIKGKAAGLPPCLLRPSRNEPPGNGKPVPAENRRRRPAGMVRGL